MRAQLETYILGHLIEHHSLFLGSTAGLLAAANGEGSSVSDGGGIDVGVH